MVAVRMFVENRAAVRVIPVLYTAGVAFSDRDSELRVGIWGKRGKRE